MRHVSNELQKQHFATCYNNYLWAVRPPTLRPFIHTQYFCSKMNPYMYSGDHNNKCSNYGTSQAGIIAKWSRALA